MKWVPWLAILATVLIGLSIQANAQRGIPPTERTQAASLTLRTVFPSYAHARTSSGVSANDAALDPNAMSWGDFSYTTHCGIPDRWNTVSIELYGYGDGTGDGDPNGGSCDVNCYVVTQYGSWEHIASFTASIGELEMDTFPVEGTQINSGSVDPNQSYKWAEGPFTDNLSDPSAWPLTVSYTGRTDGIGRCTFDPMECCGLIVRIDNITATTTVFPVVSGR